MTVESPHGGASARPEPADDRARGRDGSPATREAAHAPQPERSLEARLARLHLRGGLIALARAELETMAGQGTLDRDALADLAEARWRSGDLVGAGEAAHAHLDAGGDVLLSLVITAEALNAQGHLVEARRFAGRAVERANADLGLLFAGQPASGPWGPRSGMPEEIDATAGLWGLIPDRPEMLQPVVRPVGRRPDTAAASTTSPPAAPSTAADAVPQPEGPADAGGAAAAPPRHAVASEAIAAGLAAGRELDGIESALARGEPGGIAERLALLLRLDRALAPVILTLAERALPVAASAPPPVSAALHLVRGDAYRVLGREVEGADEYQRAMRALGVHLPG